MPSRRIVNASPLILLAKTGQLDLLRLGGVDVIVPETVVAEIEAGKGYDSTSKAIRQISWLSIVPGYDELAEEALRRSGE